MNANRLMVLLALYRGTHDAELKLGTYAQDVAWLSGQGLVKCKKGTSTVECLTTKGTNMVQVLLDVTKAPVSGVTQANEPRVIQGQNQLEDQVFHMIVAGEVKTEGALTLVVNPPKVVHSDLGYATEEAKRLAKHHMDKKFFVLTATSVHQVSTPVESREL